MAVTRSVITHGRSVNRSGMRCFIRLQMPTLISSELVMVTDAVTDSARPPTGVSWALRAQSVPGLCPESVPLTTGCPRECPTGCPESVPRVSKRCAGHSASGDTLGTLSGHFSTLRSPGPEGRRGHPVGHSLGHPRFQGHSRGHSPGHWARKGPKRLLWAAGRFARLNCS